MRRIISALLLLGLVLGQPAQARDLTKVTFAMSSLSFNFVPIHIARALHYFADEGLDVDFVLTGGGPKAMTALVGGSVSFSASVLLDGIMAHRRGLDDVRALATLSYFFNPMVVRKDVAKARGLSLDIPLRQRVALMKGLRMAITTPGASSDATVRYLAITNGLSPDRDLQIVPLGGVSSQVAGLQAGQVDGCACLPGVDILTKQQGLTEDLVRPGEMTDLDGVTYGTLYGLASYNKAHPEIARALTRAIARATLLIARDPDQAKRVARIWFKEMKDPVYDEAWATYLPYLPKQPAIKQADYDKELAFEKVVLPANVYKPVPYDQVVDTSWVTSAWQDLTK
jgi:NitT/TauT family transport system substrate-binding protein